MTCLGNPWASCFFFTAAGEVLSAGSSDEAGLVFLESISAGGGAGDCLGFFLLLLLLLSSEELLEQ